MLHSSYVLQINVFLPYYRSTFATHMTKKQTLLIESDTKPTSRRFHSIKITSGKLEIHAVKRLMIYTRQNDINNAITYCNHFLTLLSNKAAMRQTDLLALGIFATNFSSKFKLEIYQFRRRSRDDICASQEVSVNYNMMLQKINFFLNNSNVSVNNELFFAKR